jgi:hypothetical protein
LQAAYEAVQLPRFPQQHGCPRAPQPPQLPFWQMPTNWSQSWPGATQTGLRLYSRGTQQPCPSQTWLGQQGWPGFPHKVHLSRTVQMAEGSEQAGCSISEWQQRSSVCPQPVQLPAWQAPKGTPSTTQVCPGATQAWFTQHPPAPHFTSSAQQGSPTPPQWRQVPSGPQAVSALAQ